MRGSPCSAQSRPYSPRCTLFFPFRGLAIGANHRARISTSIDTRGLLSIRTIQYYFRKANPILQAHHSQPNLAPLPQLATRPVKW